ncbi:MAG: prepilin-type N-terminal cleavage/methylation domain-containing protein, partial [Elusimicrobiaceae bacterium]|nr:prepilin-type N-terminal cleavage/methylation domain-containing protein [Elusimicrobiaceae bacterium]
MPKQVRQYPYLIRLHGFTLIELLVVVLIIGILAAVAVPQYQKVVKRTRGREVLVALDALEKAQALYYLKHGYYGCTSGTGPECRVYREDLEIEIPRLKYFQYSIPTPSDQFQYSQYTPSSFVVDI